MVQPGKRKNDERSSGKREETEDLLKQIHGDSEDESEPEEDAEEEGSSDGDDESRWESCELRFEINYPLVPSRAVCANAFWFSFSLVHLPR